MVFGAEAGAAGNPTGVGRLAITGGSTRPFRVGTEGANGVAGECVSDHEVVDCCLDPKLLAGGGEGSSLDVTINPVSAGTAAAVCADLVGGTANFLTLPMSAGGAEGATVGDG